MNADAILRVARTAARRRRGSEVLLYAAPWLCVPVALAWRTGWGAWPWSLLALGIVAAAMLAWRAVRAVDTRWLARRLDARSPAMEDSAGLLFDVDGAGTALQRLQRARLRQRLESGASPDLRPPWRVRGLAISAIMALAVIAGIVLWPAPRASALGTSTPTAPAGSAPPATPRLVQQGVEIHPPAYTGLPTRTQKTLDAKVPQGTTLRWRLRFAPAPESAQLAFLDGENVALERDGDDWIASRRLDKPSLYRVVLPTPLPAPQSDLHRIDIVADQPPQLRALQPGRTLNLRSDGQRDWTLVFEAEDDYGLAATARMQVTRTTGSGENIGTQARTFAIAGRGKATHKRYTHTFDLGTLGLAAGNDLIVQLSVVDNRAPGPQRTHSPSFILRWPPQPDVETTGVDGLLQKSLPAYFRSQRQIIIDAEALQKQKRSLAEDTFLQRSDALGVDQRILRLRYGQFLGEEAEGGATLPTNDLPTNDLPTNDAVQDAHDDEAATPHAADDGHDHAQPTDAPSRFGEAGDVVARFGHTHDIAEAATLLDPKTKELLRAALDQMWQSELHLRQGQPDTALPFAYKALDFIKQVQQADRIYLPRTGSEPPPIDESRRLGGKREGLADRRDVFAAATPEDPVPMAAWHTLQDAPSGDRAAPDYDALERWARANAEHATDPLALPMAIDAARRDPACEECRRRLRSALWPLLPRPPASIDGRTRGDKTGQAYLDALGREDAR